MMLQEKVKSVVFALFSQSKRVALNISQKYVRNLFLGSLNHTENISLALRYDFVIMNHTVILHNALLYLLRHHWL